MTRSRSCPVARSRPGRTLVLVAGVVCLSLVGVVAGVAPAAPAARTVLVIYPPWWTRAEVWRKALTVGDIAALGGSSFILVIHAAGPDAAARAFRSGAIATLDPDALGPCNSPPKDFLQ